MERAPLERWQNLHRTISEAVAGRYKKIDTSSKGSDANEGSYSTDVPFCSHLPNSWAVSASRKCGERGDDARYPDNHPLPGVRPLERRSKLDKVRRSWRRILFSARGVYQCRIW